MKQTLAYFRQQTIEAVDLFKYQWKAFTASLAVLTVLYWLSETIEPGWVTYWITLPAALIIVATCYARLNSLGPDKMGYRWQVLRVGLLMIGVGGITVIGLPFMSQPMFPSWRAVLFLWGLALSWVTSEQMEPWDWYWTAKYRTPPDPARPWSPTQRLVGRLTAEYDRRALERQLREKQK